MYFQRDYVLRMIEMMGEFIGRILSIANEKVAMDELDEVAQKGCGLPMEMLRTGDADMLRDLLDEPQRFLAAELLLINIEIEKRSKTEEELLPLKIQALSLLSSLRDPDYLLPASDRSARLVRENLAALPLDTLLEAAALFEVGGNYALAEDALYAATEIIPAQTPALLAFYERLLPLEDAELIAGGLSRDEVTEGIMSLKQ